MKLYVYLGAILLLFTSANIDADKKKKPKKSADYEYVNNLEYSELEEKLISFLNTYRVEYGLPKLIKNDSVSSIAKSHTQFMIDSSQVSHFDFDRRKLELQTNFRAQEVAENVAKGHENAISVMNYWMNNDLERKNILGEFTNFGISIGQNQEGEYYFTSLFVKR